MDIIKIFMIIWIASYPKSGNTWLRSIIASLLYTNDGIFDFNLIKKIKQFPTRNYFLGFTKNFNDINEISKFWLLAQDKINLTKEIKFFKTHNLNCAVNNNSFTNRSHTLGTIYVVRDPRNLVDSIKNHYNKDNDEDAKKYLQEDGNPYNYVGIDDDGMIALEFGVFGLPETFLINEDGKIIYKYMGPLTEKIIKDEIESLL